MKEMTVDEATIPCTGKITLDTSALAISPVRPLVLASKRGWSERTRELLAKLSKALEGDHEFHKYLGG